MMGYAPNFDRATRSSFDMTEHACNSGMLSYACKFIRVVLRVQSRYDRLRVKLDGLRVQLKALEQEE